MNKTKNGLNAKAIFLQKMGHMLSGGVPFVRTLKEIYTETCEPNTKKAIKKILDDIEKNNEPFVNKLNAESDEKKRDEIMKELEEHGKNFDFASSLDSNYFTQTEKTMLTVGHVIGRLDRACILVVEWVDREIANLSN